VLTLLKQRVRDGNPQIQVRWKGYGPEHDSWEDRAALQQDCPDLVAELDARERARTADA
jgi:hypothetical protein